MMKWIQLSMFALTFAAATPAAHAGKERCKVYLNGEWELVARTFTDGGCSLEAKKRVGPKVCESGQKKFEYKYMFDGKISHADGWCSNSK